MTETQRCIFQLEQFISNVVKLISIKVTNNIVTSTPVDTGFAKANWVPSVGRPKTGVSGSRENVSSSAQKSGLTSLAAYTIRRGRVFIVNNVSYIGDLNNGTSAQAPAGFVQGGIVRGVAAAVSASNALSASKSR